MFLKYLLSGTIVGGLLVMFYKIAKWDSEHDVEAIINKLKEENEELIKGEQSCGCKNCQENAHCNCSGGCSCTDECYGCCCKENDEE